MVISMRDSIKGMYQAGGVLIIAMSVTTIALKSGYRPDNEIASLLESPCIVEQWLKQTPGTLPKHSSIRELPLIKQAGLFARFLNPPLNKKIAHSKTATKVKSKTSASYSDQAPPLRPVQSSARFTLLATSCYPANPSISLALIEEPGRGQRWIKPGAHLGYLTVDKIAKGSIMYFDGDVQHTMLIEEPGKSHPDQSPAHPVMPGAGEIFAKSISDFQRTEPAAKQMNLASFHKRSKVHRLGPKRQ